MKPAERWRIVCGGRFGVGHGIPADIRTAHQPYFTTKEHPGGRQAAVFQTELPEKELT